MTRKPTGTERKTERERESEKGISTRDRSARKNKGEQSAFLSVHSRPTPIRDETVQNRHTSLSNRPLSVAGTGPGRPVSSRTRTSDLASTPSAPRQAEGGVRVSAR